VLPLYPGYISYIANNLKSKTSAKSGQNSVQSNLFVTGLIVTFGVISFMALLGALFSTILQVSLTSIVGIISPIAYTLLAVISLFLIFNIDVGRFMPKIKTKKLMSRSKNHYIKAYLFGFFFGAIVLPCNPAFIAAMFTAASTTMQFATNMLNFIMFGMGMALPLLLFSIISIAASKQVIGFLTKYQRKINLFAGIIMLAVSIYYLFFVFRVF